MGKGVVVGIVTDLLWRHEGATLFRCNVDEMISMRWVLENTVPSQIVVNVMKAKFIK